jgi:drug/metabolite transporter (DMT)-like permease
MGDLPRRRRARTVLFLAIFVIANSFGTLLLALAMMRLPAFSQVGLQSYLVDLACDPFLIPGMALSAIAALLQLSLFSWADLSFVIPCTASSYIVSTVLADLILGEQVHLARWLGVLLIFLGVVLVARTPLVTKPHATEDVTT